MGTIFVLKNIYNYENTLIIETLALLSLCLLRSFPSFSKILSGFQELNSKMPSVKVVSQQLSENDNLKLLNNSKLKIEKFKVINAPAFVKLLSLADLGGMADLVSGEGLSFDDMEIQIEKSKKSLIIKELYAIGSSISILMEGFKDNSTNIISLRGTMIPAKNINKILSKIPVVGEIIIPKEIGEGLFGVSFKIKGKPNNLKTTVNPVRTLTPRFIQKALEKKN